MNSKPKILVSGGGTGGHIFPAIAIANELKEKLSDVDIQFVGAKGRMEMEKVPKAGYEITGLWISGLQRRLTLKNLMFPFKVISSYLKSRSIIKRFKPDVCVGTGGYASGPLLMAASSMKIPTLIHEQNAFPGITNKMLSRKVSKVCVSYPGMEKYFPAEKIVVTGNPIRKEILNNSISKIKGCQFFNLSDKKKTLLIIGGSQGARKINEAIIHNLDKLLGLGIQIIWQTGTSSFEKANAMAAKKENISVHEFIYKMDYAYAACDFIISRAGAIAIAEIIAARKPAIYVPLPSAAEDHQAKNAMSLVEGKAGLIVKESEIFEVLPARLKELVEDNKLQNEIIGNLGMFAHPTATSDIAVEVIKLMENEG